jgi:hypothetical protein
MTSPRDLTANLRALPHPAPPPDMTGVIQARIAQLEDRKPAADAMVPTAAAHRADWAVWISLGGLVAGLVIAMLKFPVSADAASLGRGGAMAGLKNVSSAPMATLALVAGFAIYVVSLFLPVREGR